MAIPSWLDLLRNPARERLLEYEISRAISRVVNPEPATIGIMSALPVLGEEPNPMIQQMGRQAQQTRRLRLRTAKGFHGATTFP